MNKPSLESLGTDLLLTTVWERIRCLTLPFLTAVGFFYVGGKGWWFAAALLAVIQSFFTYASVSHDLVHRTLRLPLWLNECLLSLIEGLNFRSGHAFRSTHLHHHQRFPAADDLEGLASTMSWWRALLDGITAQPRLWYWAVRRSHGTARAWIVAEALGVIGWACACLFTEVGQAYLILIISGSWIFPLMTSFMPHDATADDPLHQTRLFRGKLIAWLSIEHLFHLEHHLYPQVPHQRWPDLAQRLDPYFASQDIRPIILWR
jgi:beta-carotene hydroxylase